MLAKQRQDAILGRVRETGGVRVAELTDMLGVSDMTVRRDLDQLARHGLIEKVHGGATAVGTPSSLDEPGFEANSSQQLAEKTAIAEAAARLVHPGTAMAICAGTTTWALARQIAHVPDLTVVTNSPRVADALGAGTGAATVILSGGIRTRSDALVGPIADLTSRSLRFDTLFIGCHGMSVDAGLTAPNLAESETNRGFIRSARSTVLLADHTKWGKIGLSSFAELSDVDVMVTDTGFPASELAAAADRVGRVIQPGRRDGSRHRPIVARPETVPSEDHAEQDARREPDDSRAVAAD